MSLIQRDLKHLWHPCSQMKDYEQFPPMVIQRASGCQIELENGLTLIDAISSWWCKGLGHGHPRLKAALFAQAERFEHVISANTCNETLVQLSEKLAGLTQTLDKVFYAGDGSSAVEIALKMSLHARKIQGETEHIHFMGLENGYHGETMMALAVSDLGLYRAPYDSILPPVTFLQGLPYVNSIDDPVWHDCAAYWPKIETQLERVSKKLTAIIVEPIVQGAGGMRIYSQDFLKRLRKWTFENNVHLIADEIMTGLGRTGKMLACQHAKIEPDFICLSKNLTAGWLPMSAVLTSNKIYNLFYGDYENAFFHSHTYSGNALAAAVALECLSILEEEKAYEQNFFLEEHMEEVAERTQRLENIRSIGCIVAADLILNNEQKKQRIGYQIFQEAVKKGALLRPLGNTLYWLPPMIIDQQTLERLKKITIDSIKAAL